MQVVERLRSCEAACELLEKYNMSYQSESNWMDELDSKLRNLEELEAARAKEAWEKHVVSTRMLFVFVCFLFRPRKLKHRVAREGKVFLALANHTSLATHTFLQF